MSPLVTPHLLIRPFTLADVPAAHQLYGDPDVMHAYPRHYSESIEETRRHLHTLILRQHLHGISLWAVVERSSRRLIGDCGFVVANTEHFEVCFICRLLPQYRTEQYQREAVDAYLAHARDVITSLRPEHLLMVSP